MEWNVGDGVNLRIARTEMKSAGNETEGITDDETEDCAGRAEGQADEEKNAANLMAARAHGEENGDVAGFVGDGHGEDYEDVEAGDEGDEADEDGGDEFFETQRVEERVIGFHPGGGPVVVAELIFD